MTTNASKPKVTNSARYIRDGTFQQFNNCTNIHFGDVIIYKSSYVKQDNEKSTETDANVKGGAKPARMQKDKTETIVGNINTKFLRFDIATQMKPLIQFDCLLLHSNDEMCRPIEIGNNANN